MTDVFFGVMAVWVIFDVIRTVWGWLNKPKPKPVVPLAPTLTKDDIAEACLDAFLQYQGSLVTDAPIGDLEQAILAKATQREEQARNGRRELTEDDVLANLNAREQPVAVKEAPKAKKKARK